MFTAVVYALTSGCAWRHLPPTLGTSPTTAHRRFTVWTEAGLWRRLHRAVLDELGARGDYETLPARSEAMIHLAMTELMARRLTGENTISWRNPTPLDESPTPG